MPVPTLAALFPADGPVTKDDILRVIIRRLVPPLFLRRHLRREQVIGTIGEKGGGKSATTSTLALLDQLLDGKPVHSNIDIACDIVVSDSVASHYGLSSGGKVHYESIPLEKNALLKLDERYRKSAIVIEEINIEYSNVRRFMSNTNVDFNEVVQQLRHLLTSLYYNVIDEMFIDMQLRSMTDAFIKCEDTAFAVDNLAKKKPQGEDIKWLIYPMTGNFAGHEKTWFRTKKPLPPLYFHFTRFHGIFDTEYSQHKGIYSHSRKTKAGELEMMMSVESSPKMAETMNEYAWLIEKVRKLKYSGVEYLEAAKLWQVLDIINHGMTPQGVGRILPSFGISRHHQNKLGQWIHKIESFDIEELLTNKQSAAASP